MWTSNVFLFNLNQISLILTYDVHLWTDDFFMFIWFWFIISLLVKKTTNDSRKCWKKEKERKKTPKTQIIHWYESNRMLVSDWCCTDLRWWGWHTSEHRHAELIPLAPSGSAGENGAWPEREAGIPERIWWVLITAFLEHSTVCVINCQLKTFPFQSVYGHQRTPGNDSFMNYDVPTALGLSNREAH